MTAESLGLIGRDSVLVEKLCMLAHSAVRKSHECTDPRNEQRGASFDVRILTTERDDKYRFTGRVARVTVELLRVEDES